MSDRPSRVRRGALPSERPAERPREEAVVSSTSTADFATRLSEIEPRLELDKSKLDDDLEIHPSVLFEISEIVNDLRAIRDRAHDDLKRAEARLSNEIRAAAEKDGKKATVQSVADEVLVHPDRVDAHRTAEGIERIYARATALKEAWISKGFAMRDLAELFTSDYFAPNRAGSPSDVGSARRELADERRRRREGAGR